MGQKKARGRDSEATRRAVLDAAQHLFAAKGFAGTSMRELASVSGISQPLIHYHFGSKEGLYSAVKERLMREGSRSILSVSDGSRDGKVSPSDLIRASYGFVSGNEDLMRLAAWSHLEREKTPWPGEEELTRLIAEHIQRFLPDVPNGRNVDPLMATIMMGALILYWGQYSHYYSGYFDVPLARATDRYLDQVAGLFFPETGSRDIEE